MSVDNEEAISYAVDDALIEDLRHNRHYKLNRAIASGGSSGEWSGELTDENNGQDGDNFDDFDDNGSTVFNVHWLSKPRPAMITVMHFVFTLSQGIILTSVIDVLRELICRHHYTSEQSLGNVFGSIVDKDCQTPEVTGKAASFASYRTIIVAILSVIVVPRIAAYSDRHGRKWVLVWCGLCLCVCDAITLACVKYPHIVDYHYLLLASVFQGIGGNISIIQVLNVSYISDCAEPATRSALLSILDAVLFGALAAGPTLGSLFLQTFGSLSALFGTTLSMNLTCTLLVILFLPESRAPKSRRSSQALYAASRHHMRTTYTKWQKTVYRLNFLRPLGMLMFRHVEKRQDRRNARVLVAIASICLEMGGSIGPLLLFYVEARFQWTSIQTGYMMSAAGIGRVVILGFVFPMVNRYLLKHNYQSGELFTKADLYIIRTGLTIGMIGIFCASIAPKPELFATAVVMDSLAAILMPTVKNAIIKHSQDSQVGELLGALNLLTNIGMIVIPFIFFTIFRYTISSNHPAMVFKIVSALFLTLLATTLVLYPRDRVVRLHEVDEAAGFEPVSHRYGTVGQPDDQEG